jgi:membrane protein
MTKRWFRRDRWVGFSQLLTHIGRRFVRDRFTYSAAALTYTTLLSLVPVMTVMLSIFSALPEFKGIGERIQDFIFQNFVPASGDVIRQYLTQFVSQAKALPIGGTIFLFVIAIMLILTIERAMNDIWKIKRRRKGGAAILRYWALITLAPILVGASLAAMTYFVSLPFVAGAVKFAGITSVLAILIPFVLSVLTLMLVYIIMPNCRVPWRHAFTGALTASLLLEIAKRIFVIYISRFPTYKLLYGGLATIPIFLLWMYISWVIVLLGALITHVATVHSYQRSTDKMSAFVCALLWLSKLWQAQQKGVSVSFLTLYRTTPSQLEVAPEQLFQVLLNAKLVTITQKTNVVLSRDLNHYSLEALYDDLPWKFSRQGSEHLNAPLAGVLKVTGDQLAESFNQPLAGFFELDVDGQSRLS